VRGVHAAVLRLPLVVRRRADPGLPAQVLDRNPGITLLEDRDDLGLAELRLLHGTSWLRRCQKALLLGCPGLGEAYACAMAARQQREYQRPAAPVPAQGRGLVTGEPGVSKSCGQTDER